VARETPPHRERLVLPDLHHLIDPPVHETQPTPRPTCALWSKKALVGRSCTRTQGSGVPVRALSRSAASFGLVAQMVRWQFMHVSGVGTGAAAARSTPAWQ
jgi:hypothetical protein